MKHVAIIEGEPDDFGAFVPDVISAVGAGSTAKEALESLTESFNFQLNDLTERGIEWPKSAPREQLDLTVMP